MNHLSKPQIPDGDPLEKTLDDYRQLIEHLGSPDSPVGIDAKLTHAIIIDYLQRLTERLDRLEAKLAADA